MYASAWQTFIAESTSTTPSPLLERRDTPRGVEETLEALLRENAKGLPLATRMMAWPYNCGPLGGPVLQDVLLASWATWASLSDQEPEIGPKRH